MSPALMYAANVLAIALLVFGLFRSYPARMLEWLQSGGGHRFEYELRLLLRAARGGTRIEEVEIATVYLDGNTSSHFRPLRDSARIYVPLLGFALSSLVEFVLDAVALLALVSLTGQLTVSAVVARVVSGSANYAINRRLVFGTSRRDSLVRHVALAVAILAVNIVLLQAIWTVTGSLVVAKSTRSHDSTAPPAPGLRGGTRALD